MKIKDAERTIELIQNHISQLDNAAARADTILSDQLESQIDQLRVVCVKITSKIIAALEESPSCVTLDYQTITPEGYEMIEKLWLQHLESINAAIEAGDFVIEPALAEIRDDAKDCYGRVMRD